MLFCLGEIVVKLIFIFRSFYQNKTNKLDTFLKGGETLAYIGKGLLFKL